MVSCAVEGRIGPSAGAREPSPESLTFSSFIVADATCVGAMREGGSEKLCLDLR